MAAIDNCVSSNYLRRACLDSSSVDGGGNVNKSNLCASINEAGCEFYDLTVTNQTLLNNGTFTGDIRINNLTVTGTQYIEHRKNLYIGDPLITLNSGVAGANTYDIGWIGERGSSINVGTIWDESDDEFALVTTTDDGSSESVTISAYEKLKLGSIEATGKVGIGTATPDYALDVAGDAGFDEYLYHNGDNDTYIRFADNLVNMVAGGWSAIKLDTSTNKIQLNNSNADLDVQAMASDGAVILHTDAATKRVGIGTTDPIGDLSVSGSTYSEKLFHTGIDGSWLQVGTGEQITLDALSVTTAAAGVPSLSYDNSNGVFTYTPPNTGSMASKTATNYVLGSATGSMASQTATDYVLGTATGSMASKTATNYVLGSTTGCAASKTCEYFTGQLFGYQTGAAQTLSDGDSPVWHTATSSWSYGPGGGGAGIALTDLSVTVASAGTAELSYNNSNGEFTYTPPATGTMAAETAANYVLGSATGSMASQTATITDYVLKSTTGSLAAQTATLSDYVLGSSTGCAASKTCEYFTGQLFGYQTGAAQTLSDGDSPVWDTATSSWFYAAGGGGATSPGGSSGEIQFNNGGAFGGSSHFTVDSTSGFLTAGKAELGNWPAHADYAYFGHTSLDHTAGNYALLQGSDGTTYINSAADKQIQFREDNSTVAIISGGAMRIGAGGLPSGTAGSLQVDNDVIAFYTSDETLKHNIKPISNSLEKISKLEGVNFEWNTKESEKGIFTAYKANGGSLDQEARERLQHPNYTYAHLSGPDIGVIAQQVEPILPQVVSTRPDGLKAVRYDKIVPLLIEGIKEQQAQIDELCKDVKDLKYWLEDN